MTMDRTQSREFYKGILVGAIAVLILCTLLTALMLTWIGTDGFEEGSRHPAQVANKAVHYDIAPVRGLYTYADHRGSPAYNGSDVSYLQDGQVTPNSVLSACNIERDGHWVVAKGYNSGSGEYFRAYDYSADGQCEANFTGQNLEWHKIKEEGGEYGGTSFH